MRLYSCRVKRFLQTIFYGDTYAHIHLPSFYTSSQWPRQSHTFSRSPIPDPLLPPDPVFFWPLRDWRYFG